MKKPRVCGVYKYPFFDVDEMGMLSATKNRELYFVNADPKCFIGLEVEVERLNNCIEFSPLWTLTKDNSLRENGLEFVSRPLRGRLIESALQDLDSYLTKCHPNHNFSDRTSVHVHLNVRHMDLDQVVNFILLYMALEPLFFKYTENIPNTNRRENNYCVPVEECRSSTNLTKSLAKFISTGSTGAFKETASLWYKYTAFNLLPIESLGTIEFRHMGGTKDTKLIMSWVNMILSLRRYAREHSFEQVKEQLFLLNTNSNYLGFVSDVFLGNMPYPPDLMDLLEDSVSSVKDVFVLLDTHLKEHISEDSFMQSPLGVSLQAKGIPINCNNAIEKLKVTLMRKQSQYKNLSSEFSDFIEEKDVDELNKQDQMMYDNYVEAMERIGEEIQRLDKQLANPVKSTGPYPIYLL